MLSLAVESFASWLDTLLYTGVVYLSGWLPYQLEAFVLKGLFTVETSGAQETGECVFLLSHDHRVTRRLLFSEKREHITSSVEQALKWSKELDLPIQTVMCHHVEDYFSSAATANVASGGATANVERGVSSGGSNWFERLKPLGWITPQPYALVYQYGTLTTEVSQTVGDYQLAFLQSRQGYRVYSPHQKEELALLVAALLCSRHPVMMLYFLLRYQWYQGYCFGGLLTMAVVYEIGLSLILG